jgi:hypothetical protein
MRANNGGRDLDEEDEREQELSEGTAEGEQDLEEAFGDEQGLSERH